MNEAVVFGLYETGLGVIRSLGKTGIKLIGIDYKKDVAWYSRYVKPLKCPHPIKSEKAFINWVKENFSNTENKKPIFICADDFLMVISKNRKFFESFFLINLVNHNLLLNISDKYQQSVLVRKTGIQVPATYLISDSESLESIKKRLNYPVFLKGKDVNEWREKISGSIKGFKINNQQELDEQMKQILLNKITVIAQEIIQGPDIHHYKYCCYISQSGKISSEFTLRKIRQNPAHFGIGSVVESIYCDELLLLGRQLIKGLNFHGIASVEFKRDERDGKFKLIEINPRYWQQNSLTTFCGINFAFINYLDLIGSEISDPNYEFKTSKKWINLFSDFSSFLSYRKNKEISFLEWINSLKGSKIYSVFCWSDLKPFLSEINWGMRIFKLPLFIFKSIKGRK
jgi:D-aspartate ligase